MERLRKHIIFYGIVQGVGFRYTAYHAAQCSGVTGWVRNLPDGSVEAELEGTEEDIDRTIADIKNGRFIAIERMDIRSEALKGDAAFTIK